MAEKNKSPWLTLTAGMIAGGIEGIVTYPTEYIKTQLQIQTTKFGPIQFLTKTVREKGLFALYKGLGPLVVGNSTKAGVRFFSFELFKKRFAPDDNKGGLVISGLLAGMSEAILVVTPTETIKTKLIHDQNAVNPQYRNAIHGTSKIIKQEGISGIYKGLGAVMARQGANSAVRMSSYSVIRQKLSTGNPLDINGKPIIPCGAVAGTVTVYCTMPLDVCKTKLQSLNGAEYRNIFYCLWKVAKEEGVSSLWKGATPRLSRLIFSGGIVFTIYESVLQINDMFTNK